MSIEIEVVVEDDRWAHQLDPGRLVADVAKYVRLNKSTNIPNNSSATALFCSDARIRELNSRWMNKDAPTNVLSFPALLYGPSEAERYLGDIAISFETILSEAENDRRTFDEHATHMLLHGLLHLLGFDHQNEDEAVQMERLESEILVAMGMGDPWAPNGEKGFCDE